MLIILLDVTLLGIQNASLFYLAGAFKPAVYGAKLKLEFVILNRLIKTLPNRPGDTTLRGAESPAAGSAGDGAAAGGSGGSSGEISRPWEAYDRLAKPCAAESAFDMGCLDANR